MYSILKLAQTIFVGVLDRCCNSLECLASALATLLHCSQSCENVYGAAGRSADEASTTSRMAVLRLEDPQAAESEQERGYQCKTHLLTEDAVSWAAGGDHYLVAVRSGAFYHRHSSFSSPLSAS